MCASEKRQASCSAWKAALASGPGPHRRGQFRRPRPLLSSTLLAPQRSGTRLKQCCPASAQGLLDHRQGLRRWTQTSSRQMASAFSRALQGCYVSLVGPSDFGKSPSAVLQTVLKSWAGLSTCPADVDLDVSEVREAVFGFDGAHFAPEVPYSHGTLCNTLVFPRRYRAGMERRRAMPFARRWALPPSQTPPVDCGQLRPRPRRGSRWRPAAHRWCWWWRASKWWSWVPCAILSSS